ncbi:hypothetical protein BDN72DRAFT_883100 [Pluteus cervinus]|uniref:Uncharacterized protein n=1 Tax=Pluteus cervinus TaxID=181527 RepID=A0ACD3A846_9AGAR|nr:hypothetical protein BDN72DRAFT_883100 [Pluteus cervinus]
MASVNSTESDTSPNPSSSESALDAITLPPPPITAFPVELFKEIFAVAVVNSKKCGLLSQTPDERPEFDPTTLHIASVCHTWHAITLSSPSLWTTMTIYGPTMKAVNAVELYLSRAGKTAPFTLYLSHTIVDGATGGALESRRKADEETTHTEAIMDLWFAHVARWRSISFNFSLGPPPAVLLGASPEELGNIRDVAFSSTYRNQNKRKLEDFWDQLFASSSLRTVHWGSPVIKGFMMPGPFEQLTGLTLSEMPPTELLEILRCRGHFLEHLTVEHFSYWGWGDDIEPVIMPRLRELIIKDSWSLYSLPGFLDKLSTPALEELALHAIPQDCPKDLLRNFLARSGCRIRRLALHGAWGPEDMENLQQVLDEDDKDSVDDNRVGYLDQLERLSFGGVLDWNVLRPRGLHTNINRVPFPVLRTLEASPALEDGVVGQVLIDREAAGAGIWIFNFNYLGQLTGYHAESQESYPKDEEAFKRLEECCGLKVIRG